MVNLNPKEQPWANYNLLFSKKPHGTIPDKTEETTAIQDQVDWVQLADLFLKQEYRDWSANCLSYFWRKVSFHVQEKKK